MILKGITRFKTMHSLLVNNPSMALTFGFKGRTPDRITLARRFKALYGFVKEQIQYIGNMLISKKLAASDICSVDSTMHKACGNIWHKKHKKANFIPPKLQTSVPLYCEITPANNSDCPTAKGIFRGFWPEKIKYLLADKGYDDKSLRGICQKASTLLITPNEAIWTYAS